MGRVRWAAVGAVLGALVVVGCGTGDRPELGAAAAETELLVPSATAVDTAAPTTGTPAAPSTTTMLPPVPGDGTPGAVVTSTGIVVPVVEARADGTYLVRTPCDGDAVIAGASPLTGAHVVLDPGHGGDEPGAVGSTGLREADVNLAVAREVQSILAADGWSVVLTRTDDYRITLRTRAAIATGLEALAFVSIHHNADPDGPWPGPGSETYYQQASPESVRLAGLVFEEVTGAFGAYPGADGVTWVADTDAGAKYRASDEGGDYYGILRHSAGVPAVLSEAAFLSNPPEEALLATPEFRRAEAEAIARAIERFLTSDDPGSGFTEPYARAEPAGSGGGASGCVDPDLG